MIPNKLIAVLAVTTVAAMLQTAQGGVTLGDLENGHGSITIGDKTFSDFTFQATSLTTDPSQLIVSAYAVGNVDYLDFSGPITVVNSSPNTVVGDLLLRYTVTANAGAITMIDQQYTPNAIPTFGQIIIGETVSAPVVGNVANSTLTLTPTDLSDPPAEVGDNLYINPAQSQLSVIKDIQITAYSGGGSPVSVGLSDVEQSFHQVPEPTSILAGALLLLPFGASTLRVLRRNRAA